MKKVLSLSLVLLLLLGAALAEEGVQFDFDRKQEIDLNGDGEIEEIWLQMVGTEEESYLMLVVIGGDDGVNTFTTGIMYDASGRAMDLDGDGAMEIYLTGDQFSEDYATWCLRYTDEGLKTVPFPAFSRGEIGEGESETGYGRIISAENGLLTLQGTQDVLGTWRMSRTLSLKDGRFEFADDNLFVVQNDFDDPYIWETRCLTPTIPIDVTFDDGTAGSLNAGQKFVPTKTDLTSVVYFQTADGMTGNFEISPNTVDGWGARIGGRAEGECFEFLPYAD